MGAETVRARQVDELNDLTINFEQANVAFNRYAGIVANALSKTGQTIKKSTFARIRAANDRDAGIRLPASGMSSRNTRVSEALVTAIAMRHSELARLLASQ